MKTTGLAINVVRINHGNKVLRFSAWYIVTEKNVSDSRHQHPWGRKQNSYTPLEFRQCHRALSCRGHGKWCKTQESAHSGIFWMQLHHCRWRIVLINNTSWVGPILPLTYYRRHVLTLSQSSRLPWHTQVFSIRNFSSYSWTEHRKKKKMKNHLWPMHPPSLHYASEGHLLLISQGRGLQD